MIYTDGSRDHNGKVGGGWCAVGNGAGSMVVGSVTTVFCFFFFFFIFT